MRAVRIHARRDMRTEQVPSPVPAAGEVRLRVRVLGYVGICGSDLHRAVGTQKRSLPSSSFSITPPFAGITFADARLSTSQVTSAEEIPRAAASGSTARSIAVAWPRRRTAGRTS